VISRSENAFDETARLRGVESLHAERVAGTAI
jgi:hypothetical protein